MLVVRRNNVVGLMLTLLGLYLLVAMSVQAERLPIKIYPGAVADSAFSFTPRFTITQDGNVGIGPTTPTAGLHVSGGNSPDLVVITRL